VTYGERRVTVASRSSLEPATGEPPLIVLFDDVGEDHHGLVGGKGYNLGRLRRAGFPVPDGFCLSTEAMRAFIREGELLARLEHIIETVGDGGLDAKESWAFLGETRRLMAETALPPVLAAALRAAYEDHLGGCTVAVRSSGTREDMADASFAGQYESFLNVRGLDFLHDAVRRCWASIWRNRVLHYVGRQAVRAEELAMGVVVQRLVKAQSSGVLFTVNPLTGRDDQMLVEATLGLGETLVSGRVNPDRYVLEARTGELLSAHVAQKNLVLKALQSVDAHGEEVFSGGVDEEEVAGAAAARETMQPDALRALAGLGYDIQVHFQRPMDVEWARDADGGLHVVQARPITRISFDLDMGEWTDANFKDGGVASDVCAPLMASLYERIFSSTMTSWSNDLGLIPPERKVHWLRVLYARPYWNVGEVKQALLDLPGFIERDFDDDLGIERPYEGLGRTSKLTLTGVLRGLRVLWRQRRLVRGRLEAAKAFVAPFLEEYERLDALPLDELPRDELLHRYTRLMNETYVRTESTYFLTAYAVSIAKMDFKAVFDKVARYTGGDPSYLDLVAGLKNIAHLRPYADLYELAQQARASGDGALPDLAALAKRYQHHSTRELDITVPRWGEDPSFLEQTVRQYLEAGIDQDPKEVERRQVELYGRARERLAAHFRRWPLVARPLLRHRFRKGLELIRGFAWWREEVRDCSIRCYWLVRSWTLALGRRLVAEGAVDRPDDLLMLRWDQVQALANGALAPEAARREIAFQRRYLDSFRRFPNPHEVGGLFRHDEGAQPRGAGRRLRGVAGSSGTVRGVAKVVRRLEEAHKVEAGDVLVTVFTDPGWTPLMSVIGGLVTETGGLLSHAAVISREYGIPAVLACAGATTSIADGDEVLVDGAAGVVEVLRESIG
jgi:pyruvate,water dikinase